MIDDDKMLHFSYFFLEQKNYILCYLSIYNLLWLHIKNSHDRHATATQVSFSVQPNVKAYTQHT